MKQKLKKVLVLAFAILLVVLSYVIFKACTVEKQRINVKYNSTVSSAGNLETLVSLVDQNNNTKKGKIVLELLDADKKKVKGTKEKYELREGEVAVCSLPVPEDLETGNYYLRLKTQSGIMTTKKEVGINISNSNSSEIIISLDKGIYKPGDTINYRALLISKDDGKPKASKEVNVDIFDGNGNRVYSETTSTTEFGVVRGAFTLANEVNSGTYTITVDTNSKKMNKSFTVNPYILPQFEVGVESDKEVYQVGETANITFSAKYFFGEPVANAEVVGTIGEKEVKGLTDSDGKFVYSYEMKNKGEKDINVSITDTSNYLIEATKKLYAQEYAFEVETIFENGHINKNLDNTVYILAKKVDGTPVKVHAEISLGKASRQVITDDSGFGKFTLTSQDTSSLSNTAIYNITAEDNEGNKYESIANIEVVTSSVSISTDKIKYNQGDDIEISLNSIIDSGKRTIYVCKDGEVKKMISTDSEKVTLNLEDISGLVDIFVEGKTGNTTRNRDYYDDIFYINSYLPYTNYSNSSFVRKTVFIKPSKSLDIAVSTDKEEYKPGENVKLNFKIQNEKQEKEDANILVSILDEAVLSLAENDLSMDNIRLALRDIKLTDDITLADLYADVLDDKSESNLTLALLRHDADDPSIKEDNNIEHYSYYYQEKIVGLIIALLLVAMIFVGISDSVKLKTILKDVINVLVLAVIVFAIFGNTLYDIFDDYSLVKTLITISALVLMAYCLAIYKKRDKVFDLIKQLLVIPGIFFGILYIIYEFTDFSEDTALLIVLAVPVLMTILIVRNRSHKLNKFWSLVKELTISLVKSGVAYFVSAIVTDMIYADATCFIIVLLISYLLIDRIYKAKVLDVEPSEKPLNIAQIVVIGFFILILLYVSTTVRNFSGSVVPYDDVVYEDDFRDGFDIQTFDAAGASKSATNSATRGFDTAIDGLFDNAKNVLSTAPVNKAEETNQVEEAVENDDSAVSAEETTENVRNIFLESLAFLPDLVVKNGDGSTEIKLSDNITTWNIQAVGNTKEGRLGSTSTTFKVFKEFFVDFSLPTNSVVTDKTSIPVTIYNYKDTALSVNLNVVQNDWSNIGNYLQNVSVEPNSTKLVYVPVEITKAGNNTLRVEAKANEVSDIVERKLTVTPNGYKKTNVISSSTIDKSFETDYFIKEQAIENTRKLKVKIYPSAISQAIEGMENIFKMPTGCFEQTSSSLYPNILALKYLQDNNLDNEEIRAKALEYISSGYQRLLTFEVPGVKGGYSLFGNKPAEPVITAFGLMELSDASEVYDVDEQVIENMKEYLFSEQKIDGSFDINNRLETGAASSSDLAMNAYIIWAISEVAPEDDRLNSSINYLENKLTDVDDNYTLALIANAFTNVKSKETKSVIDKLMENVEETSDSAYVSSKIRDYYGSYGIYQNIQATALTSMALTKNNLHASTNNSFIKYLASNKDSFGNWGTTQATILSLKAINMASNKGKIAGQTITVTLNDETKEIKVVNNPLDIYEVEFDNVKDDNKIKLDIKKGNLTYELIEEYYVPYETISDNKDKYDISVTQTINQYAKVNDTIKQNITITNNSNDTIANGVITVNIPQGCSVNQIYLDRAVALRLIEKYEYNYSTLNLYIRNFKAGESRSVEVNYKANYPEEITGGGIRVYDYYNPNVEGLELPVKINVGE